MPTFDYTKVLLESLKDREEAVGYLNACFQDSEEVFLLGLRNVVEAQGGVGELAKLTGLNRENLYRILSEQGNPKLSSLLEILNALGFQFKIDIEAEKEAA